MGGLFDAHQVQFRGEVGRFHDLSERNPSFETVGEKVGFCLRFSSVECHVDAVLIIDIVIDLLLKFGFVDHVFFARNALNLNDFACRNRGWHRFDGIQVVSLLECTAVGGINDIGFVAVGDEKHRAANSAT